MLTQTQSLPQGYPIRRRRRHPQYRKLQRERLVCFVLFTTILGIGIGLIVRGLSDTLPESSAPAMTEGN
jgi:hypothetical protein